MKIDPTRIFEVNGEVCQLKSTQVMPGAGVDIGVIACPAGQRIRVMGWLIQSVGATAGSFKFKDGPGGTGLTSILFAPPSTNGDCFELPIVDSGYIETSTDELLYVDVAVAQLSMTIFYITYTPV